MTLKTMTTMKKQTIFFAVALLTAGALLTSCSSDDVTTENPTEQTAKGTMTFTATLAPKDAPTRSVDADGVTTWVENEKIGVYYQKTDDSYGTAIANVDEVNGGAATISASLTDAKNGGTVKFVYPATLQDDTNGELDATKLATQHGTIADISANFDAATGSGTLVTDGTTCGTSTSITMTNQVLIGKFTSKYGGAAIDGITTLTVSDGTNTYTVTPASGTFGTGGIYVAMLPVSDKEVIVTAATASQSYGYGGKKISLAVGNLYDNLAIKMGKLVNLTGRGSAYTAEDGDFVTGTLTDYNVTIPEGYKVTLSNVTLTRSNNNAGPMICEGNNTITLSGTNSVRHTDGGAGYPAIYAGATDKTLTIKGCGQLTATAKDAAAAIGAGKISGSCGNIRIESGEITAQSGYIGVAIGAAGNSGTLSCGDITITGGHIIASKAGSNGTRGPAIGCFGHNNQVTCGNITISGGTVVATAEGTYNKTPAAAGIGTGYGGICGSINVSAGTVTATKSPASDTNYSDIGIGVGGSIVDSGSPGTITVAPTVKTDGGKGYVVNSTYGYNQEP